jgi:hypothetical protein
VTVRPSCVGRWVAVSCAVAGVAAMTATPAAAGSRDPSARELWQQYPLRTGPSPGSAPRPSGGAAVDGRPQGTAASTPRRRTGTDGGVSAGDVLTAGLGMLAVSAVGGWAFLRDRRGRRRPEPRDRTEPVTSAPPALVTPPEVDAEWTAEVDWLDEGGRSRFRVVAVTPDGGKSATLAESRPLDWPPDGPRAVQAMTDAADALDVALCAGGWRPLPSGDAWYARRYAWEPRRSGQRFARWVREPQELWQAWRQ